MKIDKKKLKELMEERMEERVNKCINYEYPAENHRDDTDAMFLSGYCMYESSKKIEKLTLVIIILTVILIFFSLYMACIRI